MSTEVHPPTPPPHTTGVHHNLSRRLSFRKLSTSRSQAPINTESPQRSHRRSTSLQGLVSRILPTRREERGHTLRPGLDTEGPSHTVKDDHDTPATKVGVSSWSSQNSRWGRSRRGDSSDTTQSNGYGRLSRIFGPPLKAIEKAKTKLAPRAEQKGESSQAYSLKSSLQHSAQAESHVVIVEPNGESNPIMDEKESSKTHVVIVEPNEESNPTMDEKESSKTHLVIVERNKESNPVMEKESSKTQQMFEQKKARREQRRALQESGDFLGVQGANPRTGYFDISDTTSSTELSQTDDLKKCLEVRGKQIGDNQSQIEKFEAADAEHYTGIERAESDRDSRKRDTAEQKKLETKLYPSRLPRWKATENEWSSIVEPTLSPVEQSLAGSPLRETASDNQTVPWLAGNNPPLIIPRTPTNRKDYFVGLPATFSPFIWERSSSKPAKSAYKIPRKPVGSGDNRQKGNKSDDTVLHTKHEPVEQTLGQKEDSFKVLPLFTKSPKEQISSQKEDFKILPDTTKSLNEQKLGQGRDVFLDQLAENKATATLCQSVSTKQVEIRQPLVQNRQASNQGMPLNLPPVYIKDPVAARTPQSYPHPAVWAPPTIMDTEPDIFLSSTNTCTITTTGCIPKYRIPCQLDGADETKNDPTRHSPLRRKQCNIPLRTMYRLGINNVQSNKLGNESPTTPVATATLSEHKLEQTKERTPGNTPLRTVYRLATNNVQSNKLSNEFPTTPVATATLLEHKLKRTQSNIPLRTVYRLGTNNVQSNKLGNESPPTTPVTAAISSEHKLEQTKERTSRLCHQTSLEGERVEMKNTPTFTSTSLRSPSLRKQNGAKAQTAARKRIAAARSQKTQPAPRREIRTTVYQNMRHEQAVKKSQNCMMKGEQQQLSCPRLRPKAKEAGDPNEELEAILRGLGDTGSPSNSSEGGE
ncbi:hypothetical protein LCER1_G005055, partial [Lachnellula cervina]